MFRIREMRERRGLSQTDLASALEVERSTVTKWESADAYPRADKIPAICKILVCTPNDLFGIGKEAHHAEAAEG